MSLSHKAAIHETENEDAIGGNRAYGFVLVLVCIGLVLVAASAILTPVSIGSGLSDKIALVGP